MIQSILAILSTVYLFINGIELVVITIIKDHISYSLSLSFGCFSGNHDLAHVFLFKILQITLDFITPRTWIVVVRQVEIYPP